MMKKKMVQWALLFCGAVVHMQSCAYVNEVHFTQEQTREYMPEIEQAQQIDSQETQEIQETQESESTVEEVISRGVSDIYYAYHALDAQRQKVYLEMLDILTNMQEDVRISTMDKSVIDPVFACVMNDHPELFYVTGYQYTEYSFANSITGYTFSGTYSMTGEEVEEANQLIEQSVQACFEQASFEDEYSIVKSLYDWLIDHTEYDSTAENNQNICSVFLQGRSVCQGYAKAMQYLLQKLEKQCLLVTGFTNGERHAWNLVKVNGAYYYLDPTWGDASYAYSGSDSVEGGFTLPSINYDYFLVTTDEITRTHSFELVVELPECVAISENYYVHEGLYFDSYDEARLADIFNSEQTKALNYVTVKCSDSQNYEQMMQELIDSQKIFNFIGQRDKSIAYASNEDQRTISFWDIY